MFPYDFPQDRVTDHRIKESWHNLTAIMDGGIEDIIDILQTANQRARGSWGGGIIVN